jgi:hypothetical protein
MPRIIRNSSKEITLEELTELEKTNRGIPLRYTVNRLVEQCRMLLRRRLELLQANTHLGKELHKVRNQYEQLKLDYVRLELREAKKREIKEKNKRARLKVIEGNKNV